MKSLRVFSSLILLGVVLSFGFARLAKAEDEDFQAKCNCYIPNQSKYGVAPRDGSACVVDDNCFILLN